ncbi:hypothetical protein F6V30_14135 [Oryzomonas sagensis]|uniref:Uncharacterized protein n=1 Tax=Oryzomonas sagensis TaxID=2603857 RepID=A0ABQ6TL32_9BACT|nr:hypothetical protein [Oryzomonas sagensis]KAB0668972.1 hypothetical protein F6V30_14135 [Oryzomonas sagensis]
MAKKTRVIRHGDLALVKIDKLPEGLQAASTQTLMQGSGGNNHDVRNGTVYLKGVDQFVFGYLMATTGCTLLHPDHGAGKGAIKTAKLPAGVYELRRQFEHKHESMTQVVD